MLVEVGPGHTLGVLARQEGATRSVQTVRQAREAGDDERLLVTLRLAMLTGWAS